MIVANVAGTCVAIVTFGHPTIQPASVEDRTWDESLEGELLVIVSAEAVCK